MIKTLLDRFLAKVEKMPNGCWRLTNGTNRAGYGEIQSGRRRVYAHRAAYELFVGPIPEGMELDHLCRNRSCCNPAHLEAVTHHENMLRGASTKHGAGYCGNGHERNAANIFYRRNRPGAACRVCAIESKRNWRKRQQLAAGVALVAATVAIQHGRMGR